MVEGLGFGVEGLGLRGLRVTLEGLKSLGG